MITTPPEGGPVHDCLHYCEASASVALGTGFFRAESRPSRDLGVLLARWLQGQGRGQSQEHRPLRVLDLMAGCGIRSLRYGQEAAPCQLWVNDADTGRLSLLRANLAPLMAASTAGLSATAGQRATGVAPRRSPRITALTAQKLLARCLLREQRFDLIDLDAFGCPTALVAPAIEALAFGGVLYLASSDGRSPTGHDRPAAVRSLGAAARAHPASWELALRLQIGVVARTAWALGRGIRPLCSFSEGRTFRTAIQLVRQLAPQEETLLGFWAHCHGCGDQFTQSLLGLRRWPACACSAAPVAAPAAAPGAVAGGLAVSGPLWLGPLQDPGVLEAMVRLEDGGPAPGATSSLSGPGRRLLLGLGADAGVPARCWPTAELGRRLGGGPPALAALVSALRADGWTATASGVMAAMVRSDAPWGRLLEVASDVRGRPSPTMKATDALDR